MRQRFTFAVVGCVVLFVFGAVAFTTWYAVQSLRVADTIYANNIEIANDSGAGLRTTKLRYTGLKFTYSPMSWEVRTLLSHVDQDCGKQDSADLQYNGSMLNLSFSFGACGKLTDTCFGRSGTDCIQQSQQLAKVVLSSTKIAYVLARRTSIDNGKTWNYSLWLADSTSCSDQACSFTVTGLQNDSGNIFASFEGEGNLPHNPQTLAEFIKLPPVAAAVRVLEAVHY